MPNRTCDMVEIVTLTENCNAIIMNKMPPKLKDPGNSTIPCAINKIQIDNTLCDLGASVSLMTYSVYQRLELGELLPSKITLQLADRSIKIPKGKVEDVPLRVGKFVIPVDFIVLDMDEDATIPIILGRPFLDTSGAMIDVKSAKISLKIGEEAVEFDLNEEKIGAPSKKVKLYEDLLDGSIEGSYEKICMGISSQDALQVASTKEGKGVPMVELKPLASHLRYEFFGPSSTYREIVSASLSESHTQVLCDVLRKHQGALGYTIDDLKGISPALCTHHITLEE
ncbi:uncharacterized protein LOC110732000 [Chenopodium quinoa]|uniref:uncharacterized protein LOC110732000 n=1 Tax=Chenopodium quinoa TaxID=63459 RepID=UPI000B76EAA9|nr:uncharacterized protein LOC110732000 [Chenopodium quinoa]